MDIADIYTEAIFHKIQANFIYFWASELVLAH
jgi:hypothetical protein